MLDKVKDFPLIDCFCFRFGDNGDCLDAKMLDELTTAVGKVSIEKPKSDYKVNRLCDI